HTRSPPCPSTTLFRSEGQDVPTRYEIDGTTVTQVIEHTGDEVTHPVTADPWLGIDLFSETSNDLYEGDLRVNAQKSTWGQINHRSEEHTSELQSRFDL